MLKLQSVLTAGAVALVVGPPIAMPRTASAVRRAIPFDAVSVTIEVNATDLDAGVILFNDTEERLHHLSVQDPSGNVVYEMTSSDAQGLGLTEMSSETAEPDIPSAFSAYPEGNYTFSGEAFDGTPVTGVAFLSHTMPAAPDIRSPEDGDVVNLHHAVVSWVRDDSIDHYWIEIEQEDPPSNFTIQLQPGVNEFRIPSELLRPSATYLVGVGAVGANGNATVRVVEIDTQ